jgi:hypothetical protein
MSHYNAINECDVSENQAIPCFAWNWLGSTKSFLTSLLHPTDESASDHEQKQEYTFCFMLLFLPF